MGLRVGRRRRLCSERALTVLCGEIHGLTWVLKR